MTRMQRFGAIALSVALAAGVAISSFVMAAAPGAKPIAAAPKTRPPSQINDDLQATQALVSKLMPATVTVLGDPDFRKGDGQKVAPLILKMSHLLAEMQHADVDTETQEAARQSRYHLLAYGVALGNKDAVTELDDAAKLKAPDSISAGAALAMGHWLAGSKDAAAQQKVLEDLGTIAKANPTNEEVASVLSVMAQTGAANADLSKKAVDIIRSELTGPAAASIIAQLDSVQAQQDLVGKPLAFGGRTSIGGNFATNQYKGKVVLVDFWATWCGPCIAELPNVKSTYEKFHDKGLEIVGVSCDNNDAVLNDFTKDNNMPWIQLHEASQNEADQWHPIAKKYHVDGIPTMFLIDRKGVLRYVDAREDLAKKVADLLAETDIPSAPKP